MGLTFVKEVAKGTHIIFLSKSKKVQALMYYTKISTPFLSTFTSFPYQNNKCSGINTHCVSVCMSTLTE